MRFDRGRNTIVLVLGKKEVDFSGNGKKKFPSNEEREKQAGQQAEGFAPIE